MVAYVLQALGCDVSAIDTVHFSMLIYLILIMGMQY